MTAIAQALGAPNLTFNILFKAIFGFAVAAIVLTGAVFAIAGKDAPSALGIAAGFVGAFVGILIARRVARVSTQG